TMGDCGAFSYIDAPRPPYTADDVIDYYETAGFDAGVSVDHVIPIFDAQSSEGAVPRKWKRRYELTLQLAGEFLEAHSRRRCGFEAIGVAQGWSPGSYAKAVARLQKLGYERIALGGLVPLKSHEILAVLDGVSRVRHSETKLHLFGVTRCEMLAEF